MGDIQNFTTIRSMLEALAKALNLINPELEHHHEQTAYLAFMLARQMHFADDDALLAVYAATLHDVGAIVVEEMRSVAEIEQQAQAYCLKKGGKV